MADTTGLKRFSEGRSGRQFAAQKVSCPRCDEMYTPGGMGNHWKRHQREDVRAFAAVRGEHLILDRGGEDVAVEVLAVQDTTIRVGALDGRPYCRNVSVGPHVLRRPASTL
jgi:hypothetical protein